MNKLNLHFQEKISSKNISYHTNRSLNSSKTNDTYIKNSKEKHKKSVSFKKNCVEIINVECWKKFNEDASDEQYVNKYDINMHKKNKEISCTCYIY